MPRFPYFVQSKETGYNSEWSLRGSLQQVDSDLVQRHITGFAEQAKFTMQRVTEQIAAPFTEQILFLQKKLDDANECNERNMRIKCELEEENKRLKKDKEELESKVNASLAALVRVETECSNLKQQVENLRIKAKSPDISPVLSRQISTSSVLSSSSDVSTEGVYYASLSNVDTIPSNDYLYSKEIPSVIFEDQLGEQKKDFSKKKYRLCNVRLYVSVTGVNLHVRAYVRVCVCVCVCVYEPSHVHFYVHTFACMHVNILCTSH